MKKYKISQVRSAINQPEKQKVTLKALGLRKLHNPVVVNETPQLMGMINKVKHLLHIEEA